MNTKVADDYAAIAARLKEIEAEKMAVLTTPLPDVKPNYAWDPAAGYVADYDGA